MNGLGTVKGSPSGLRRAFVVVLALGSSALVSGCDPDPSEACALTYRHLLELAKRNNDPALMTKFVDACRDAYDPERLACIKSASTAGAALACKPVRKRPG